MGLTAVGLAFASPNAKTMSTTRAVGTTWVIAEGHQAVRILNASESPAHVILTICHGGRAPMGSHRVDVPARRTTHVRLEDLVDRERVPFGTEYSCIIESDVPIVALH